MMQVDSVSGFQARVAATVSRHGLLRPGNRPLVALSGGADSVALLRVLLQLGYDCGAAHCNFRLRDGAADADEAFVRQLCQQLGVRLHVAHFDTRAEAARRGVSVEMAARQLRYTYFSRLLAEFEYDAVAVAHHRDDNVETLLLNLVRGSGLKGLTGMRYRRAGSVIRPLLDVSRADVENYLCGLGQPFVTDSTNFVPDVKRNVLRLQVIPLLRQLNPSVSRTLQQTISRLTEADELASAHLHELARQVLISRSDDAIDFSVEALRRVSCLRSLLHYLLAPYGFGRAVTDCLADEGMGRQGAVFVGHDGWRLWRERGMLQLRRQVQPADSCMECGLTVPGRAEIAVDGHTVSLRAEVHEGAVIVRDHQVACLDADGLKAGQLALRPVRQADRFVPLGMKGSKLVSDYLTDCKRTRLQKRQTCVLCCGADIVWLVGERTDQRYAVRPGQTRRTVVVRMEPATPGKEQKTKNMRETTYDD